MALTTEQQAQVDIQIAVENVRHANQLALQAKQTKLEAVRLAKETLIENARSKPADSRDVTAADITAFADALVASINA
jgi:hypothetical protein